MFLVNYRIFIRNSRTATFSRRSGSRAAGTSRPRADLHLHRKELLRDDAAQAQKVALT